MPARPVHALTAGALSLVLLSGCGKPAPTSETSAPTGATSATPATTATGAPTATPATGPTATPAPSTSSTLAPGVDQQVAFRYRNGTVTGPRRVKVAKGSVLRLVVTSDKADTVHLHGYDKLVAVAAGATVEITVKATISGTFAVELEKRKVVLTRIQVQ